MAKKYALKVPKMCELKINLKYLKKHLHFQKRYGIIVSAQ